MNDPDTIAETACRACAGLRFRHVLRARDFDTGTVPLELSSCTACGLVRAEPVLADDELNALYLDDYYGVGSSKFTVLAEQAIARLARRRARALLRTMPPRDTESAKRQVRVLDVGCGRAVLLSALNELGCECHGIERSDFPEFSLPPGLRLHRGPLAEACFEEHYFDLVVIWHVLEHLAEPVETLTEARRVLHPDGTLVVAVPNFASLQARIFGRHWFHLDLPRHRHHFTPKTLAQMLCAHGMGSVSTSTFAVEQNIYGFVQSALNSLTPFLEPNKLYAILKGTNVTWYKPATIGWLVAAALIVPFALLELVGSQLVKSGATVLTRASPSKS